MSFEEMNQTKNNMSGQEKNSFNNAFLGVTAPGLQLHYFFVFAAIELILGFSWIGFIYIQPVSITTLHIPVLLGAIFFGKWMGAALGGVFGLLSLWHSTIISFSEIDAVFTPFGSPDPLGSLMVSVGTRILFCFCAGWLYEKGKRFQPQWLILAFLSFLAVYMHSLFVFSALEIFFPALGVTAYDSLLILGQVNGILSEGLAVLIVPTLYLLVRNTNRGRQFTLSVIRVGYTLIHGGHIGHLVTFFVIVTVLVFSVVMHLINRIIFLLNVSNYTLSDYFLSAIYGFGMQFGTGIAAVSFLLAIAFIYFYNSSSQAVIISEHDSLTKVYNRDALAKQINTLIQSKEYDGEGILVLIDLDHFKNINDQLGHPYGDQVLRTIGDTLQRFTGVKDIVGRMGGDEFCVYLPGKMDEPTMESRIIGLFALQQEVILKGSGSIQWSFGITHSRSGCDFQELYREADDALYVSKHRGRNCYHYYGRLQNT